MLHYVKGLQGIGDDWVEFLKMKVERGGSGMESGKGSVAEAVRNATSRKPLAKLVSDTKTKKRQSEAWK